MSRTIPFAYLAMLLAGFRVWAGPYSPAAGQEGSEAVPATSVRISAWAFDYTNYVIGEECDEIFQTPQFALGPATGDVFDIVTLGRGGQITLRFAPPITDGPGMDFAVFENAVTDTFLELAYVEVSSDGTNFVRFIADSLTSNPIGPFFDFVDPTDLNGLAGSFRAGYGTPFDLADLPDSAVLDPARIGWVRILDVVGDGTSLDGDGDPIYDPYPTVQSGGFDLEAVGAIHQALDIAYPSPQPDGMRITFHSGLHRRYQVEFNRDLKQPDGWSPVGVPLHGDGSALSVLHTDPPAGGTYRIRSWMESPP